MKAYNYTNWKEYLIHLLETEKVTSSEVVNLFLNTATQAEIYLALEKGDLVNEREAEKFHVYVNSDGDEITHFLHPSNRSEALN